MQANLRLFQLSVGAALFLFFLCGVQAETPNPERGPHLPYARPYRGPLRVTDEELRARFAPYFAPEFQARQKELTKDVELNKLMPVIIHSREGSLGTGDWSYIDSRGKTVLGPFRTNFLFPMTDGMVQVPLGDQVHFLDKTGRLLRRFPKADTGWSFSEGLLYVNLPGTRRLDSGRKEGEIEVVSRARGYVDKDFNFVFRLGEDSSGYSPLRCEPFHDGMAAA